MEENLYTRIEDYLDNAMSDQDRLSFEAEARDDPAVAEALAYVREARTRLRRHWEYQQSDAALEETLRTLGRQYFQTPARGKGSGGGRLFRLPLGAWWAAAAAAALLIAAWLFLRPPANERLYARYRQLPDAAFTIRNAATDQQYLQRAEQAFNSKDYAAALATLQTYLQNQPGNVEAQLFAGLCLLELRRPAEAQTILQTISAGANAWSDEASWYLALACLLQNKRAECAEILQRIPQNSGHYAEAQELLNKVKR